MKKLFLTVCLAAAVISASAAFEATVTSAKGKVEIQRGTEWKALAVGAGINKGDVIQTGFKSELILKVKDSVVTIGPLSRMTVEQMVAKESKDDTRLYLDTGSLKANVKKTENRRVGFTVKSPVATASVRGTIVGVTNSYQTTVIETFDGLVAAEATQNGGAQVASDEEDAEPETPQIEGDTVEAVSGGVASESATLVRAGQQASVDENKPTEQVTAETKAVGESRNLGGTTELASVREAVAMGDTSTGGATLDAASDSTSKAGTGTLTISFKFPEN